MEFSRLIDEFLHHQTAAEIDTPDGWTQGRTAYGGLTGALMLAAVQSAHDDLPPCELFRLISSAQHRGALKFQRIFCDAEKTRSRLKPG